MCFLMICLKIVCNFGMTKDIYMKFGIVKAKKSLNSSAGALGCSDFRKEEMILQRRI